jgi:hypothetical protein
MPLTAVPNAAYVVRINQFQLDPNTTETVSVRGTPVLDSAQRTVVYTVWRFQFRTVLYARKTADTTTDFQMNSARQLILSPGGAFQYKDRGFGELEVNTGKRQKDVRWGPFVKEISWEPWGDANAGLLEFSVEVAIPECNSAKFENHALEWNFNLTYDRDPDGFTTRKISGHLLIPQTRDAQGNRRFRHTADEYREKVSPRVADGFRPLRASFKLNDAKDRLEFNFEEEEMGADIPPPGVLRIDADMDGGNQKPGNFVQMIHTLNATYTIARGFPMALALVHFQRMAFRRREATKRAVGGVRQGIAVGGVEIRPPMVAPGDRPVVGTAVDMYWRVGEPRIYNKAKQAKFSYTWAVTNSIFAILRADGYWTPVPDSNYKLWKAKLNGVVFAGDRHSTRGQAGLFFGADEDIIVDLCQADVPDDGVLKNRKKAGGNGALKNNPVPNNLADRPTPDSGGWVLFEQSFFFEAVASLYIHKPVSDPQTNTLRSNGSRDLTSRLRTPNLITPQGGRLFASGNDTSLDNLLPSIIGERAPPTWYVTYVGRAVRVGATIDCPQIKGGRRPGSRPREPARGRVPDVADSGPERHPRRRLAAPVPPPDPAGDRRVGVQPDLPGGPRVAGVQAAGQRADGRPGGSRPGRVEDADGPGVRQLPVGAGTRPARCPRRPAVLIRGPYGTDG